MAADPKTQSMFDNVVRQGLQAVSSPEVSQRVAQDAQTRGPDAAITEAVIQALQGIKQAAQRSGVEIPPEVMQAAAVAMAQVMISMMVDSGMVDDPDGTLKAVMMALKGGQETGKPGNPANPANPANRETPQAPQGMLKQPMVA
jgi:hypothetical protein